MTPEIGAADQMTTGPIEPITNPDAISLAAPARIRVPASDR